VSGKFLEAGAHQQGASMARRLGGGKATTSQLWQ
jgi:hypothetical protein